MTRRPRRPEEGRVVGGVCAALAQTWDIDVTLLRLAFLLLTLTWGLGAVVYLVAWLALPPANLKATGGRRPRRFRGIWGDVQGTSSRLMTAWTRAGNRATGPYPLSRRWMGLGLLFGGFFLFVASVGLLAWITPARALGLATMAVGAAMIGSLGENVRSKPW